jgi:non-ribosomal peptide synthetase component F
VDRPLPDELVARLKEFGQRANASLFMLVTAAYVTLLRRYSGQDDLIIGTLVANRNQAEVEDLVGFFTNTAALRFDLAGDPSVRDLLARVRETTLGAYAHQDVPFHRVVEELQPRRTPGEPPWFNAMVQLADVEREPATVAGVLIEPLPLTTRPAPVELVVSLVKESGRYRVVWDFYDSTRLREDSVAAMHDRLVRLLDGFTADLDRPVSAIEMLAPGETLPAPAAAAADEAIVDDDRPAPEGPWETLVAEVWAEVLGYDVGEIAATDDFFDLGGHSLAAGRVLNRIARRTGVHLATRVLFDEPQLRALAGALAARSGART